MHLNDLPTVTRSDDGTRIVTPYSFVFTQAVSNHSPDRSEIFSAGEDRQQTLVTSSRHREPESRRAAQLSPLAGDGTTPGGVYARPANAWRRAAYRQIALCRGDEGRALCAASF